MAQPKRRLVTRYRIFWTIIVVAFVAFAYVLFDVITNNAVFTEIDPKLVQIGQDRPNPNPQGVDEGIPVDQLDIQGLDMSIQSADGSLVMHVWADKATKDEQLYHIGKGSLLFAMQERQTLLLTLTDCQMDSGEQLLTVGGAISGHIIESNQYFEATELEWNLVSNMITTSGIRLIGGNLEVSGERMSFNLHTGEINFEGKVDARY